MRKGSLRSESCVACRAYSPKMSDNEIAGLHPQIADWQLICADGIKMLCRKYKFRNFDGALTFAQIVGEVSEAEGHHPRLTVEWGRVVVEWWTHKIKGIHRNDFIMAAKTDAIYRGDQYKSS